jgi:hypothetical protein
MRRDGAVLSPQSVQQSLQVRRKLRAICVHILPQPFTYRVANRSGGLVVNL